MNKISESMLSPASMKVDPMESCLNNIGLYIIHKIREEDLKNDKFTLELKEADEQRLELKEDEIKPKIAISEMILNNKDILMILDDFYEEDCQFSLLCWACDIHKRLRHQNESSKSCLSLNYYENLNNDFFNKKNSLIKNAEILLFNILNIFELFPIKPDDLKSLNFIEKLKEIKKDMKNQNIIIYKKIKNLINFWKSMIQLFDKQKPKKISDQNILNQNKKRLREDEEITLDEKNKKLYGAKEDNEYSSSNLSLYETDSCEQNETKKKSVSWKSDDVLVDKIEYNPTNAPNE